MLATLLRDAVKDVNNFIPTRYNFNDMGDDFISYMFCDIYINYIIINNESYSMRNF